jgi:membrane protease YdiL (CAAX protease family)
MNWQLFFKTIGGMVGTFSLYKVVTLFLLHTVKDLQNQPYYQFIYLGIILLISIGILLMSKRIFNKKIRFDLSWSQVKKQWLLFIVPIILFGIDFIGLLPDVLKQSFYLLLCSVASAFGAAFFEETRDRGFGITGLNEAIPVSKWKPLILASLTSLLFAFSHWFNLLLPYAPSFEAVQQQVFYTFFMGLCFSVLRMRTGTIFYGVLFHFMSNLDTWTPSADLAAASDWSNILVIYGIVPLVYALWCLRPQKSELNLSFL